MLTVGAVCALPVTCDAFRKWWADAEECATYRPARRNS
jgi:hypothetical protein